MFEAQLPGTPAQPGLEPARPLPWMDDAYCAGDDRPTSNNSDERAEAAALLCTQCPVTAECLGHGLRYSAHWGVWGGRDLDTVGQRARARLRREAAL